MGGFRRLGPITKLEAGINYIKSLSSLLWTLLVFIDNITLFAYVEYTALILCYEVQTSHTSPSHDSSSRVQSSLFRDRCLIQVNRYFTFLVLIII